MRRRSLYSGSAKLLPNRAHPLTVKRCRSANVSPFRDVVPTRVGDSLPWLLGWRLFPLLSVIALASPLAAKDRVVLQPRENASPLVLACEIADYTAETISVHINSQTEVRRFPADEITSVEAVQLEAHQDGVRRFHAGQIEESERLLKQALEEEPRDWVRREILGWLVKCAMRRGNRAEAGNRFLELMKTESAPREYPLIPLVWGAANVGTSLRQEARGWLTDDSEVSRLLGASVLLLDTSYGDVTRSELRQLARSFDRRISALARAQLWRLRVTATDLTESERMEWERDIESMPQDLRAGPYFVLGRASFQRSDYDRATSAFLWLTTVYSENESLTAQATVEAGRSLMRLGRDEEARTLLEEVNDRFDWSTAAAEARALQDQLPFTEDNRRDG